MKNLSKILATTLSAALLSACGGSDSPDPEYTLAGNVAGLNGTVVINVNNNPVSISVNGAAALGSGFKAGDGVTLTVSGQPVGQTCAIEGAASRTFSNANISNINISCANTLYTVGGNATGVTGPVTLNYSVEGGREGQFELTAEGNFTIGSDFTYNNALSFSVSTDAALQCEISPSTITIQSDFDEVEVSCQPLLTVSGSAAGLARPASLQYVYQEQTYHFTINEVGNFTLPTAFLPGAALQFSVPDYLGHQCTVLPTSLTLETNFSELEVSCETFGEVSGQVTVYSSGLPIEGAKLEVYVPGEDNTPELIQELTSDERGNYALLGLGYSERIVIRASADNYVTRSDVFRTSENNPNPRLNVALLDVGFTETFPATAAKELIDPVSALRISLPASAFVDTQGQIYSGDVTASVTNIDASSDPAIMPGYYLAIDPASGEETSFESFGALNAAFKAENGEVLQLADNKSAQIRIPLASRAVNPPQSIPLIHFNEKTGIWTVEDEVVLSFDEQSRRYYSGEVNHFSTWNADYLFESVNITGCAIDNISQLPMSEVKMVADGMNYIGRSVAYTNAAGEFTITVRPNSQVLLSIRDSNGQSNTTQLLVANTDLDLENCITSNKGAMTVNLSWGQNPRDLDTHFKGPTVANSLTERFHVFFADRIVTVENETIFLDVDDTNGFGPEILTVPRFPLPGRYMYSVHHYSGTGSIFQSPTRVEVVINGERFVFSPSEDQDTRSSLNAWLVFEVEVNDEGDVQIIPVNRYVRVNDNDVTDVTPSSTPSELPIKQYIE
ncbi:hypothetical protein LMJ53_13410 [Rheinheimera sp. UJ51]|uniref:YfaP family protein n=1 Tax=Rheinheimera sp. UJ51 TaxID=2892446 RepID=UPI001E2FFB31|nr:hypothetical protein [Rheinheimera sp. UJ51]MCC5452720.1 hypothetical protein [Rheinheimera sp. UJ51]